MSDIPLEQHTVKLVLSSLCASTPSIPEHFVSPLLAKRHAFLDLSPEQDAEAYLLWPSDDNTRIMGALRALQVSDYDFYPIQYTADPESVFAHVHVRSNAADEVRVVFNWDAEDAQWKYHNVSLMPFPVNSHTSLEDALKEVTPGPSSGHAQAPEPVYHDDDDYWNAYGQDDDGAEEPSNHHADQHQDGSEDAYWAQYSAIHGTADSTIPSPLPVQKRRTHYFEHAEDESVLAAGFASMRPRLPSDPPCPVDLNNRLENISPRSNSPIMMADDHELEARRFGEGVEEDVEEGDSASTGTLGDLSAAPSPKTGGDKDESVVASISVFDEETEALKDSIKGLYKLWKLKRGMTVKGSDDLARLAFTAVVSDAIATA
ncbi:hypothetical protein EV121DRAFT_255947 [Schizophyllum commune]